MPKTRAHAVEPIGAPEPSDAELVLRARADDRWAREAIYRRHVGGVAAMVIRLSRSRDGAEDVVQDAFVEAFSDLDRLRDPSALRPWLCGIAVHKLHRVFRRRALLRLLGFGPPADGALLAGIASKEASPDVVTELALVDRALARTTDRDRIAWMLRHVEGEQLGDIAQMLGCSLATVKRRISTVERVIEEHVR